MFAFLFTLIFYYEIKFVFTALFLVHLIFFFENRADRIKVNKLKKNLTLSLRFPSKLIFITILFTATLFYLTEVDTASSNRSFLSYNLISNGSPSFN